MALTLEQTGGVSVVKVSDTFYYLDSKFIDLRDVMVETGQGMGRTEQERESLILLYLTREANKEIVK